METVSELDIDLFFVQETWLMKSDTSILQEVREYGYEIVTERKPRTIDIGGGVAVVYKKSLNCKILRQDQYPSFEFLTVYLMSDVGKIIFTNLYYPGYSEKHKHTYSMFLSDLEDLFDNLLSVEGKHMIFGDFNLHVEDENRPECKSFERIIQQNNVLQLVRAPTHKNGGTLDLFLCGYDSLALINSVKVTQYHELSNISDHSPVRVDLRGKPETHKQKVTVKSRKIREYEISTIRERMQNSTALHSMVSEISIEAQVNTFNIVTEAICTEVAPIVVKTVHPRPKQCWYNEELRDLKRVKRRAERRWVKHRSSSHYDEYKAVKLNYYTRLKEVRTGYYKDALATDPCNLRKTFDVVHKLSGESTERKLPSYDSDVKLAEDFVKFFDEKIKTIRRNIQDQHVQNLSTAIDESEDPSSTVVGPQFGEFSLLDSASIHEVFMKVSKKYCCLDPVPINVMVGCAHVLEPILLAIINKSLTSGIFPKLLKQAVITPVLKCHSSDPEELKNYRPISNTPFVAKMIEKTVLLQLNKYLYDNKLCSVTQSAYKEGHSCETALLDLVNDVQSSIHECKIVVILMLDLSAAFDTIDHETLLHRLRNKFRIAGVPLSWITSYLQDRSFLVKIRDEFSSKLPLTQGVPQGSILGPVLFIMYIDDISEIAQKHGLRIHVYADDTTFYVGFKPTDEFSCTMDKIKLCLQEVKLWMLQNFLKLNLEKTQILFCCKPNVMDVYSPGFQQYEEVIGIPMKENLPVKVLGVKIDQFLKFDDMIGDVCKTGYFKLNKLKTIRNALDTQLRITLVRCYILNVIDYCNVLYANLNGTQTKRLQMLMNASIRFIYNLRKSERVSSFMKKCHFLPVKFRKRYKLCIFAFKVLHSMVPEYLDDLVSIRTPLRDGLRSSAADMYIFTRHKDQTIAARMVEEWNQLPETLRKMSSLDGFKGCLKTHLFIIAYE